MTAVIINHKLRCFCDECGSSDVYYGEQDLREIEPIKDANGKLWACFEPWWNKRYGCKKHPPLRAEIFRMP